VQDQFQSPRFLNTDTLVDLETVLIQSVPKPIRFQPVFAKRNYTHTVEKTIPGKTAGLLR
jgi:hypothetical protein